MSVLQQVLLAVGYYVLLLVIFRLAGKRSAGQTTTFDLIVLIGLAVTLQNLALRPGRLSSAVFIATVFALHVGLTWLGARSRRVRRLLRGAPRPLIEHGRVSLEALANERLSYDELLAGLRKAGFSDPAHVRLAILEETGHISAVGS